MNTEITCRVAILDDHQAIIDGYSYRLGGLPSIELVGTAGTWEDLEALLAGNEIDVLLLDINVPISRSDASPYPVMHALSQLKTSRPDLAALIISVHDERALIQAVMKAGASGYVLKDDTESIKNLASIVSSICRGGIYMSARAKDEWLSLRPGDPGPTLTDRQTEVLSLAAAYSDLASNDLAGKLGIEGSTLRNTLSAIYQKLGVRTRAAAILKARHLGLITPFPSTAPYPPAGPEKSPSAQRNSAPA